MKLKTNIISFMLAVMMILTFIPGTLLAVPNDVDKEFDKKISITEKNTVKNENTSNNVTKENIIKDNIEKDNIIKDNTKKDNDLKENNTVSLKKDVEKEIKALKNLEELKNSIENNDKAENNAVNSDEKLDIGENKVLSPVRGNEESNVLLGTEPASNSNNKSIVLSSYKVLKITKDKNEVENYIKDNPVSKPENPVYNNTTTIKVVEGKNACGPDEFKGVPGVIIEVKDLQGSRVAIKSSDSNGYIYIENLEPGNYKIEIKSVPPGYKLDRTIKKIGISDEPRDTVDYMINLSKETTSPFNNIATNHEELNNILEGGLEISEEKEKLPVGSVYINNSTTERCSQDGYLIDLYTQKQYYDYTVANQDDNEEYYILAPAKDKVYTVELMERGSGEYTSAGEVTINQFGNTYYNVDASKYQKIRFVDKNPESTNIYSTVRDLYLDSVSNRARIITIMYENTDPNLRDMWAAKVETQVVEKVLENKTLDEINEYITKNPIKEKTNYKNTTTFKLVKDPTYKEHSFDELTALAGGIFKVCKDESCHELVRPSNADENGYVYGDDNGNVFVKDLIPGEYYLENIGPPNSYAKIPGTFKFEVSDEDENTVDYVIRFRRISSTGGPEEDHEDTTIERKIEKTPENIYIPHDPEIDPPYDFTDYDRHTRKQEKYGYMLDENPDGTYNLLLPVAGAKYEIHKNDGKGNKDSEVLIGERTTSENGILYLYEDIKNINELDYTEVTPAEGYKKMIGTFILQPYNSAKNMHMYGGWDVERLCKTTIKVLDGQDKPVEGIGLKLIGRIFNYKNNEWETKEIGPGVTNTEGSLVEYLDDGNYWIQVTDSKGKNLIGDEKIEIRPGNTEKEIILRVDSNETALPDTGTFTVFPISGSAALVVSVGLFVRKKEKQNKLKLAVVKKNK